MLSAETGPGGEIQATAPSEIPRRLLKLAREVAPAVVSLRAWDSAGNELARGSGCFIDGRGAILTDTQVVHPEFANRIEYITVSTGSGAAHRITGYWARDIDTGLTLLQSDADPSSFLTLSRNFDFSKEQTVSIVALHGENDLALAEARIRADRTQAAAGGLNVRGEDSPGEPGSPVIDREGRVVAIISMRVPQGKWFNFASRIDATGALLARKEGERPLPLADLGRIALRPLTQDTRFFYAFQTLARGDALHATPQFLRLLKTYPRSPELWALLGLSFGKIGAKEEALDCNRKAVALEPEVGQYWYQLALSHLDGAGAKDNPAAREALERATEMRPGDPIAWLLLAEQQLLGKNYAEAEKALTAVAKLTPDSAVANFLLGYVKAQQGDHEAAERIMRRSLQLDRKQARVWFYLALLYTKEKRFSEAVQAYEEVVRIQPEHPSAWRNLALLQRRLGHASAASAAFARHQRLGATRK